MDFRTTLSLGGKEFDVLDCDYKRDADGKGRPPTGTVDAKGMVMIRSIDLNKLIINA